MVLSDSNGAILHELAYAKGKMLDHSKWDLPRRIKPSDIDMCVDNDGDILFCEITSHANSWEDLDVGQRRLYISAIGNKHVAVLVRHNVIGQRQIDTINDVVSFEVMARQDDEVEFYKPVCSWPDFITRWWNDAAGIRKYVLKQWW
jgi:hypothetical protein